MQVELTARGRRVPEHKVRRAEEIRRLMESYDVIGVAKIEGIGAKQLQELRNKLRGQALIKVEKNTLVKKAIEKLAGSKKGINQLEEHIKGPVILILTNMNPFKLNLILEKSKTRAPVKPETVTPVDIVVPAGNTGLPPGPVISELGSVGLPTRVESGTIWITKDTLLAKAGDVVSKPVADVLRRLGIEPLEVGLSLLAAYDGGIVISEKNLKINVQETFEEFKRAHMEAFNLAVSAQITVPEAMPFILQKAHMEAFNLAINAAVPANEVLPHILRLAESRAISLAAVIASKRPDAIPEGVLKTQAVAQQAPPEKKEEKAEEKEEEAEEEIGGLGSLFG
ncbi:MAG: 50S ribosomal protein L10 [Candidatus Jordarchaeales archaeon]|nr:50S ribosomal protein L10 [Candidatus Jordarchaeia archaeon]